jgi:hypothetical protein
MIQFSIRILASSDTLADITGLPRPESFITMGDLRQIVELEQQLERLTGLRFHIQMTHQGELS